MGGTSPERITYLLSANHRLRKFVTRARSLGWSVEGSRSAENCIIVRSPESDDHFVLYPSGTGSRASLSVYDGREGYEFSPIPTRDARIFIASSRAY